MSSSRRPLTLGIRPDYPDRMLGFARSPDFGRIH